jgi:hypothetical protein
MSKRVRGAGAGVQESRHPGPRGRRPRTWRWAVPREDLKRLLAEGLGVTDIARRYGVNHSTISSAVRALDHQDLVAVALGNRCQPKIPEVPVPDLQAPVDVMGEVMSVIEDIRHMRAWLVSDEAKAALKTQARVNYVIALFDKRLRWAETFISTRSKLLELITFDHWLNEMLAIIEAEGRCPKCGTVLNLKERIRDRIHLRLVGRDHRPRAVEPATEPDAPESGTDQEPA